MAALAADVPVNTQPVGPNMALTPTVSTTYYAGSIIGLNKVTGRAVKWVDASNAGVVFQGLCPHRVAVDASGNNITPATLVNGVVPALVPIYPMFDRMAPGMTVAGVTAVTDVGSFVYSLTDNVADLTLTAPADDRAPLGIVWRFKSAGVADVLFLSPMEAILMTLIGVYDEFIQGLLNPGFSTGETYAKVIQGKHGLITNFVFYTGVPAATGSSTSTVQANINGGSDIFAAPDVIALADVDASGEVFVTDQAVVAANAEFHDGDTLNVIMADGGTPMTGWTALIGVRYRRLIGV